MLYALRGGDTMTEQTIEKVYKSAWHALIAAMGFYELRNHKTKLSKVLAVGLICFHIDACISDAFDQPTIAQKLLRKMLNK
jgi:hypothetical protein